MSKSKKPLSNRDVEKLNKKMAEDLQKQNFKTAEEANEYIQKMYSGHINDDAFPKSVTPQDKALDLLEKAYNSEDLDEQKKLAEKALNLDPDCCDAYTLLAEISDVSEAEQYYLKALEAAKKTLGSEFDGYKGHFWGFHETRPYMKALFSYSEFLWSIKRRKESVDIMKEMLELNDNDNQGVRYILITRLLIMNKLMDAEKLLKAYPDESSASWLYSKAFLWYSQRSKTMFANGALIEAMNYNPFIPLYLAGERDMPHMLPSYITPGQNDEAIVYTAQAIELWGKDKKYASWFASVYMKMEDMIKALAREREAEHNARMSQFEEKMKNFGK